jgi:hypothetical protein
VNNINDVWESDLVDVQGLIKYNDGVKYLLTVVNVFSKFLHIPLKRKTGKAVTPAFQSIFKDPKYLKPILKRFVWVCTDKGKECLNNSFQGMLKVRELNFRSVEYPTSNNQSSKGPNALSGINYKNTSHTRTRTDSLMYSSNLFMAIMRPFTVRPAWCQYV